jgi:hypothetical protein
MQKPALKIDLYHMSENWHLKTQVKLMFLQIFETLHRPWKDENKILKKNQVGSFKTVSYRDLTVLIKTGDLPNTGLDCLSIKFLNFKVWIVKIL